MKLVDTLNLIENCSTLEELQAVMQKAISHYGFSSFAFLGMWPAASRQPVVLTNNSPDWDSTYRKENFYAHDPVLSAAKTSNSAFTWSHLVPKALNKKQSFVMRTAHDFGYREGVIVPFHYSDAIGRRYSSCCTLFWKNKIEEFKAMFNAAKIDIHVVVLYWAQRAADIVAAEYCAGAKHEQPCRKPLIFFLLVTIRLRHICGIP